MKWYTFYTPDYIFYKNHMEERLHGSRFEFRPISLESLTLSNCDHHFLNNTVKIQLVIIYMYQQQCK